MEVDPEVLEGLKRKHGLVKSLFASDQGQEVLKILQDQFNPIDLRGEDPYDTHFHLGQRDVVMYLEALRSTDFG